jgi:hypothetical protein
MLGASPHRPLARGQHCSTYLGPNHRLGWTQGKLLVLFHLPVHLAAALAYRNGRVTTVNCPGRAAAVASHVAVCYFSCLHPFACDQRWDWPSALARPWTNPPRSGSAAAAAPPSFTRRAPAAARSGTWSLRRQANLGCLMQGLSLAQ